MADDMTPGEIRRTFDRVAEAQRATDGRLNDLAKSMVPTELWGSEHRALQQDVTHLEQDMRAAQQQLRGDIDALREEIKAMRDERAKRAEITWQKVTSLVAALAALALVIVTMIGQSKGIAP